MKTNTTFLFFKYDNFVLKFASSIQLPKIINWETLIPNTEKGSEAANIINPATYIFR